MKDNIIDFFFNWVKKEINQYIISFISGGLLFFFNRIGALPDIPFIVIIITFLLVGITLLFSPKYISFGKYLLIIGICLIPFVIRKNNARVTSHNDSVYTMSCDELVRRSYHMDSIGWALYEERNPEILAWIGCSMIESFIQEDKTSFIIPELKYADSLLNESRKGDVAYAYLGRAMKEFYGLGGNKSLKEAVRDALICLEIKHCDQAYNLLESMRLDSTEFLHISQKVHEWRDSVDNSSLRSYDVVCKTFIPNRIPHIIGMDNVSLRTMVKSINMYDSVYSGNKSSNAWKVIHENKNEIKRWGKGLYGLLAAYYWGIGKVDSARMYCDSIGTFYNNRSQFCDFSGFEYNKKSFDRDVITHLDDVLRYSSIKNLEHFASITKDPILQFAFESAMSRKNHLLDINEQNDAETFITLQTNVYIKQLRPRVK